MVYNLILGFPSGLVVKKPPVNARDVASMPGSGRPPGEGNGSPLQYSCLGNPMGREARQAHVVAKCQTRQWLNNNLILNYCYDFMDYNFSTFPQPKITLYKKHKITLYDLLFLKMFLLHIIRNTSCCFPDHGALQPNFLFIFWNCTQIWKPTLKTIWLV